MTERLEKQKTVLKFAEHSELTGTDLTINQMSTDQNLDKASSLQQEDIATLEKMIQTTDEDIRIGVDTGVAIQQQNDQLRNADANVKAIDEDLRAAKAQLRKIANRPASDKLLLCLACFLILLIAVAIIVASVA